MPKKKTTVAICYDFDGTLIRGNMQENSFIPDIGMTPANFWAHVKENARRHDMDEVLSYMQIMLNKARDSNKPFNKKSLQEHGKDLNLFPGVDQWFELIGKAAGTIGVNVEHYIISSGLDDMIRGSAIGNKFKHIFASGFTYDANDVPVFAARSINYTTKVQHLFRINKGIYNSWDNNDINKPIPESERDIPFSRMIYIGDGETDVPAMKMVNFKGGYSIAVHPPKEGKRLSKRESEKRAAALELKEANRVHFVEEADYTESGPLFKLIASLLNRIRHEDLFAMNHNASKG